MVAALLPGLPAHAQRDPGAGGVAHGLQAGVEAVVVLQNADEEQLETVMVLGASGPLGVGGGRAVGRPRHHGGSGRERTHPLRGHEGQVAAHGEAGEEEVDSQAAVGEELSAVSALQPRLQDRVNALPEAGKAPVDIPVEDPHRRPGALTVAEEGQIEERVRRQVTRLGQGVGDRRILSVDELGPGSCGDCGAHPAHGPTSLRGIARHLHDPVADGGESPAHGDWPQHRGGNPIRLKREGRVKDHEPGGVAAARGGTSTNHAVRAHNVTSCLMPAEPDDAKPGLRDARRSSHVHAVTWTLPIVGHDRSPIPPAGRHPRHVQQL